MKEMSFRLENAGKGQGRNWWQTPEKSQQVKKSATTCGLALLKPPSSGGEQAGSPLFSVHAKGGTSLSSCRQVSVLWFANIEFSKQLTNPKSWDIMKIIVIARYLPKDGLHGQKEKHRIAIESGR